jgi:YcaO-like protein with predicted kinase domain
LGIESDEIFVEDFGLFGHAALAAAIERFIDDAPGEVLPLTSVTVVQYVRAGDGESPFETVLAGLQTHAVAMTRFATRYNVEINLHVYVQHFNATAAADIASFADSDALDGLGFFFDFSGANRESIAALKAELALFCRDPAARNPKVRLGNFPFCLFPPHAITLCYRDAVSGLKGHIDAQRDRVRDVNSQDVAYHEHCAGCRCRAACHAYTEIGVHPDVAGHLTPRHERALVFAGGSLSREDAPHDEDLVWCGPVEQGDMLAAVLDGFETILIIDGYFYTKFPCTTFEVMVALEQGINVFGSSSIGALRAVELDRYVMVGVGEVYRYLKEQPIKPYHVVAQTYDERDHALTTPLIEILYFLECAEAEAIVTHAQRQALNEVAGAIHFTFLSFEAFFRRVQTDANLAGRLATDLRAYRDAEGADRFNIKQRDAHLLVTTYAKLLATRPRRAVARTLNEACTRELSTLRASYARTDDFTLPVTWHDKRAAPAGVARDRRACSAQDTCTHARDFLADLNILVADTTGYDPAGSHILSTFFVPFFFLNYSPASATGNGDQPDEALASAYMELVERLSACGYDIRGRSIEDLDQTPIALDRLPQAYNWGAPPPLKAQALADHGYVSVTDIAHGAREWIPAFSLMFRYSGTDGFASGNTLPEATLYGLYEVIERDTCQIHLLDPTCRALLPHLRIDAAHRSDPRCRHLQAQLEDKGCEVVLFLLPNLYDLPCVMCHVYDRNRKIQCHGGIAVRADVGGAMQAALHEAVMQYITYFVGTRDDYVAGAPDKQARVAYANAQDLYINQPPSERPLPNDVSFTTIKEELDHVVGRLTSRGPGPILVADLSPRAAPQVKSVKVIVPGLELWFCPDYQPSPFLADRAAQTAELVRGVSEIL